ncbi:MAG: hypothetical protein RSA73_01045 [Anaerovoracaceae bacterium]
MENIALGIVTKDRYYGRALSLAIITVHPEFSVTLFEVNQLYKAIEMDLDLILSDLPKEDMPRVIQLVDKPSMVIRDSDKGNFALYKYGNVRKMTGDILFIYSNITGRKPVGMKTMKVKVVAVGSSEGGVGCTSVALALAQEYTRYRGGRALYLSMEELESTLIYMEGDPKGRGMGEYLYHIFHSQNFSPTFLEGYLLRDSYGVEAFGPSKGRNLLLELSEEEFAQFFTGIVESARYKLIVIDVGTNMSKVSMCAYNVAKKIIFIERQNSTSIRGKGFLNYLAFIQGNEVWGKIVKAVNFSYRGHIHMEEEGDPVSFYLPRDDGSFYSGEKTNWISIDNGFGLGIKKISEFIERNLTQI